MAATLAEETAERQAADLVLEAELEAVDHARESGDSHCRNAITNVAFALRDAVALTTDYLNASGAPAAASTPSAGGSRIGEFFYMRSGSTTAGVLAVTPGTVANGAIDNPIWAAMYPEFVVGDDIVFGADVDGVFLRNLGGNAGTEATFQTDATAANGLRYLAPNAPVSTQVNGGTGNTVRGRSTATPTSLDPETRPINIALQLYTILDGYGQ